MIGNTDTLYKKNEMGGTSTHIGERIGAVFWLGNLREKGHL
jgi:hypothetical protein